MPLTIRILQHEFQITREYTPGHVINEAEATALNQMLMENVRTNVYNWVTREARGRGVLTPEQHALLHSRIERYADDYKFKTRVRSRPSNPHEAAVRELAWQHAEAWGSQLGYEPASSEVYAKFVELRSSPKISEQARNLVLHRQTVVAGALEGLL